MLIDARQTLILAILTLFLGKFLIQRVAFLRTYNIPEPVTGGVLVSVLSLVIYSVTGNPVEFDLASRDVLLIIFFTTVGLNAKLATLAAGGKPLLILVICAASFLALQNLTGVAVASALGTNPLAGVLGGSISLSGGHGTAIAWAPIFSDKYGISGAAEIGIACATFGLVLASLMGGPVAKFLIQRHNLKPETTDTAETLDVGIKEDSAPVDIHYMDFLDAVLSLHICIIIGVLMDEGLETVGVQLPLFVSCLFGGILMSNLRPKSLPRITGTAWPSRTPAIALIADVSLGAFLAMSLMSMQLWELAGLAGPLMLILGAQVLLAIAFIIFVVFPLMGKNYEAAVISAGFGGFSMGATPTAMANMSAVTKRYGACHQAFIIVPLVGAFFIDIANVVIIKALLGWVA